MSRAPKVTLPLIKEWIAEGIGQGHGSQYKTAMPIRRCNPSGVSVQVVGGVPPYFRRGAFYSRNEWLVGQALAWAGTEPREQFPIWPWEHPHSLVGLVSDLDPYLPRSEGMLSICKDMGIDHGVFIGTGIPYIWTMDFSLVLRTPNDEYRCGFVSVKPIKEDRFHNPEPSDRVLEKLEAERRYALALGVPYRVTGASEFPGELLTQLEWLRGAAVLPHGDQRNKFLQEFLDRFVAEAQTCPPEEWIRWLQVDLGASGEQALSLCHHIIWHQYVDFDLTKVINFSYVPQPGGRALKHYIQEYFLGGEL